MNCSSGRHEAPEPTPDFLNKIPTLSVHCVLDQMGGHSTHCFILPAKEHIILHWEWISFNNNKKKYSFFFCQTNNNDHSDGRLCLNGNSRLRFSILLASRLRAKGRDIRRWFDDQPKAEWPTKWPLEHVWCNAKLIQFSVFFSWFCFWETFSFFPFTPCPLWWWFIRIELSRKWYIRFLTESASVLMMMEKRSFSNR